MKISVGMMVMGFGLWACGATTPTGPATIAGEKLNGCDAYEDRSAGERVVAFGGSMPGLKYSPACIAVKVGQTVTFNGEFEIHPLAPGTSPDNKTAGTQGNPIPATDTGKTLEVTFNDEGTFPYICVAHYGGGMFGAVTVVK